MKQSLKNENTEVRVDYIELLLRLDSLVLTLIQLSEWSGIRTLKRKLPVMLTSSNSPLS